MLQLCSQLHEPHLPPVTLPAQFQVKHKHTCREISAYLDMQQQPRGRLIMFPWGINICQLILCDLCHKVLIFKDTTSKHAHTHTEFCKLLLIWSSYRLCCQREPRYCYSAKSCDVHTSQLSPVILVICQLQLSIGLIGTELKRSHQFWFPPQHFCCVLVNTESAAASPQF